MPTDGSKLAAKGIREGVRLAKAPGAKITGVYGATERAAREAVVPCRTRLVTDPQPRGGILREARRAGCAAIVMASHGRGAIGGLILGSETSRVLAHSKIPVLVAR